MVQSRKFGRTNGRHVWGLGGMEERCHKTIKEVGKKERSHQRNFDKRKAEIKDISRHAGFEKRKEDGNDIKPLSRFGRKEGGKNIMPQRWFGWKNT